MKIIHTHRNAGLHCKLHFGSHSLQFDIQGGPKKLDLFERWLLCDCYQ